MLAINKSSLKDPGGINASFSRSLTPVDAVLEVNEEKMEHDDYDPHSSRDTLKGNSNFVTFIHILKSMLGTGILAMPKAFYQSGYILAIILTLFCGILSTYCTHTLIRTQHILCKRHRVPLLSYKNTMSLENGPSRFRSLAPHASRLIDVFMLIMQLGTCTVYFIFIAKHFKASVDQFANLEIHIWILILLVPLTLLACIRNMTHLAPFSTIANLFILVGLIFILVFIFEDTSDISISKIEPIGHLYNIPLSFGTILFALVCINVCTVLENDMSDPRSFTTSCGVLNWTMGSSTILYIFSGFIGYLKFRDGIKDIITLNLDFDLKKKQQNHVFKKGN